MGRSYKGIFFKNITDRPIFGRINQNSAAKVHKPTIQKSKIIKKLFFHKIYANDVSWSILVQERPTTPKVLFFLVTFCQNGDFTHMARSSSGWVFMNLKVFLLKILYFQLHYSCTSCLHISHQSKVTNPFREI